MGANRDYILRTWGKQSLAQQAAALGISVPTVKKHRRSLICAGVAQPTRRSRPYPPDTSRRIRLMLAQGATVAQVARALRRSPKAIETFCTDHGISIYAARTNCWTAYSAARVFGVHPKTARAWFDAMGIAPRAYATRAQVGAFLENRAWWPTYDPERIIDPELAASARFARRMARGQWVPVLRYSAAHYYSPATVREWCRNGKVTSLRCQGLWYVWEAL